MRLAPISPDDLTSAQKALYDDMRKGIASGFNAFKTERERMSAARLAMLVADLKPTDLTKDESAAFDLAYSLCRGDTLPEPIHQRAIYTFGPHGTNELIYQVGLYSMASITLNGFNVPVPGRD
jgi:4-carboxymuconolactone decarboxylase